MTHSNWFPHERLDAYHVAMDLASGVQQALASFPRGVAKDKDQLRRSSTAIVRNLCEGASRRTPGDKAQYFGIALAEAAETQASLEMAGRFGYVAAPVAERLQGLNRRVGAMLAGLVRRQRALAGDGPP